MESQEARQPVGPAQPEGGRRRWRTAAVLGLGAGVLLLLGCTVSWGREALSESARRRYLESLAESGQDFVTHTDGVESLEGGQAGQSFSWLASAKVPLKPVDFEPPAGVDYHIDVAVYTQSQDPRTQMFLEWVMVQVVGAPGILKIIRLRLVPWGRATLGQKGKHVDYTVEGTGNETNVTIAENSGTPVFFCENGPSECEGNAWLSCVQTLYPDIMQWFRVTTCIQVRSCSSGQAPTADAIAHTGAAARLPCSGMPGDVAPRCIREFGQGMDFDAVDQCVHGQQGSELLIANMIETEALHPKLKWLPYVTIDDKALNYPNRTDIFLLGRAICDAYVEKLQPYINGTVPRPLGCYYFPREPPYLPKISLYDQFGVSLLWAIGGVCFFVGVVILVCWKYQNSRTDPEYERLEGSP